MSCIVLAVILGSTYLISGDRYIPWIKKEIVYIAIDSEEAIPQRNGSYKYDTTGVTPQGKKRQMTFKSPKKMTKNVYLKLVSKGNYIESWEEVLQKDMPNKVINRLQ